MNKKLTFLLFFIILYCNIIQGQNKKVVDSLETLLKTDLSTQERVDIYVKLAKQYKNSDSLNTAKYVAKAIQLAERINYKEGKVDALCEIAWATAMKGYFSEAEILYEQAIQEAELASYKIGKANGLSGVGAVGIFQGNYEKALDYHFQSLEINEEIEDKKGMAKNYNNIGIIYENQGNHEKALDAYFQSLKLKEELGDKKGIASSYNNIGIMYNFQKKHKKALDYFNKGLKIAIETDNKFMIAKLYVGMSQSYANLNDLENALKFSSQAMSIYEKVNDKPGLVSTYITIGGIYIRQEKFNKGISYLKTALKISTELGMEQLSLHCYSFLGEVYYDLRKFKESKENLENAIMLAIKVKNPLQLAEAYENLSITEKELGNYQAAYEAHVLYKELSDSLFNEEKSKQISELEIQYESEKKDQEIIALNQEAEIKDLQVQRRNFYLIGAGILAILLLSLGFVLFRQNRLQNQQKTTALEQRLLRSQMNPHFIFNSLIAIQNYIYQNKAAEAGRFLAKFSQLMRAILEGSRYEFISLEEEINLLENYLILQQLRFENKFTYKIEVDDKLNQDEVSIPPMLAQPFLENAIEHGFKNLVQKGELSVRFSTTQDEKVLLEIEDNGIGLNQSLAIKEEQKTKKISRATQITQERLKLLNNKQVKKLSLVIRDRSEIQANTQGTSISLAIPKKFT